MNICQNCATINNEDKKYCENCGIEISSELIDKILPFARDAAHFGFFYREEYERQVKEHGEVKVMYSLLEPSNYIDLMAVFALSGYVGGVSFKIVNFIGNQILKLIKNKDSKVENDKQFEELFENKEKLEKFVHYINDYYTGKYLNNKKVANAIIEEEMAHFATNKNEKELADAIKKFPKDEQGELLNFFTEIANGVAKRKREIIPRKEDLKVLFAPTKKELVKSNKTKTKKKKKKKK